MDRWLALPADLDVSQAWRKLTGEALSGTILLVGATDTGKSTLARWLLKKARDRGQTVAWLDGDLGQSSLGIPGTLNLLTGTGENPQAWNRAAFFIGSNSPRGHMLQVLTGLCRLRDLAQTGGADPVIIDTSGLIAQEFGGGTLKEWEVELLMPSTIIALQRGQELEHLLAPWRHDPRLRLYVLPVAAGVRCRSPEQRSERRRRLFRRYFDRSDILHIHKEQKPMYGLSDAQPGCLTGLIDRKGYLLGVGVITRRLPDELELLSPCTTPEEVTVVRVGKLRIDPASGAELHRDKAPLATGR